MGTGNYDEDGYLRYFCKAGDGTVDVQLIADLHKSEVFAVGRELGVAQRYSDFFFLLTLRLMGARLFFSLSILVAPPTADLWEGQTDEDEMGFSYDFVEIYTTYIKMSPAEQAKFRSSLDSASQKYLDETGDKAKKIHDRNAHKASWPLNLVRMCCA